jgi:hypothetical protein
MMLNNNIPIINGAKFAATGLKFFTSLIAELGGTDTKSQTIAAGEQSPTKAAPPRLLWRWLR